jgi:xanthine dehydrogenase accessory factor
LLIVGGGHCGRALAEAASLLGYEIVVADDRAEFARAEDFAYPGVAQVLQVGSDFGGLPAADDQTYVVVVSKGFASDEAALRRVIGSPAAYIGMIGSRGKRDYVFERLRAEGISDELLARVHVPIGLEIGAETPAEIAVSILAEIVQVRARRQAGRKQDGASGAQAVAGQETEAGHDAD